MKRFSMTLKIIKCSDPHLWYADRVGEELPLIREYSDCFMSREPEGYMNVIRKSDAEVVLRELEN